LLYIALLYCFKTSALFSCVGEEPKDVIRSSSTLSVTQPPSAPPTPTHLAGTGNSFEFEDRGDLIRFYNTIYVPKIQGFALKLSVVEGQVMMHSDFSKWTDLTVLFAYCVKSVSSS
jgi:hypothetical protein